MLDKIKSFSKANKTVLIIAWLVLAATTILLLFEGNRNIAGVTLFLSGLAGFGPRLNSTNLGSASGMVLLYSSIAIGSLFGFFPQIVAVLIGGALTFQILKIKGE